MGKCIDCIHNHNCLSQIKDSDFHGNIAGCNTGFFDKTSEGTPAHACEICKFYGSSHKRMPCKGCINNGVVHADYFECFREQAAKVEGVE